MQKFSRILIKLSGESLMGDSSDSIDKPTVQHIIGEIKKLLAIGAQVSIVIGGGNFFRGLNKAQELGLDRVNADYMGMLATIMNGLLLKDCFIAANIKTQVFSALNVPELVENFNKQNVLALMKTGGVAIFVAGTGNPFFTTDTAAALRAVEIEADLYIKATKVDGIYDKDPKKFNDAKKYQQIDYKQAISDNLKIMDMTAFALCMDNKMTINVCNIFQNDSLLDVVSKGVGGTFVKE